MALNKSNVASLKPDSLTGGTHGHTGGFQSWTGTAEPCFSDFDCGGVTNVGCVPVTQNCVTQNNCPVYTDYCGGTNIGCNSDSVCPPGVQCY